MKTQKKSTIVTVGTFDGLHRGHQVVLDHLVRVGKRSGCSPIVFTFDRHPLALVNPAIAPKCLMDADSRDEMIRSSFPVEVVRLSFTPELMNLTAREWMELLQRDFSAEMMVLGYDNKFGSDGKELSFEDICNIGTELGIEVRQAPKVKQCSSTLIRRLLADKELMQANAMLGRSYSLKGTVVKGRQIGRTIGFPTANIMIPNERLLPAPSVYLGRCTVTTAAGEATSLIDAPAMVNIGSNPTVSDSGQITVEAHILAEVPLDLYGKQIEVKLEYRLRDEQKFENLGQLKAQLEQDMIFARGYFNL